MTAARKTRPRAQALRTHAAVRTAPVPHPAEAELIALRGSVETVAADLSGLAALAELVRDDGSEALAETTLGLVAEALRHRVDTLAGLAGCQVAGGKP